MLGAASAAEARALKAGRRHAWKHKPSEATTSLVNRQTGKPRAPHPDHERGQVVEEATNSVVNQVPETVGNRGEAEKSAEKGMTELTSGSGMAAHGGAGVLSSAITSGVSVKTAKINQQTAEKVSENTLQGIQDTNTTNQQIATMQNNSNLQNMVVQGNAQALDSSTNDKHNA